MPAKFRITWKDGRYFVSIPNYEGGEVVRADIAERMAEALEALVRINEEHNEAISQIIGHPLNWKDDYLDQARSALFAFRSATQDTEARHD
jgi:hypothetical protein